MSGIVGIWNLDGRPVERTLLIRLSRTLAHRGPDGDFYVVEGPVGLACQLFRVTPESVTERQPLVRASGTALVFDGRLDNRDELLNLLGARSVLSQASPDLEFVLAAYEVFGDEFAQHLNGDFAFALFDASRQRCLLVRDAIGVRPLYYCRTGSTVLFASEIKALLAHPMVRTRPNDAFLARFLTGGRNCRTDGPTFFEGIETLPPGHIATITRDRLRVTKYWDFDLHRRIGLRSFEDYAIEFRRHFEQAVRRRLRSVNPVAVSVSGGLDSSSIYCAAQTIHRAEPSHFRAPLGASYVDEDDFRADEQAYLAPMEELYASRIVRVPMGPPGLMDWAAEEVKHSESLLIDPQGNSAHRFYEVVRNLGSRVLLTGHWGDQILLCRSHLINVARKLRWWTVYAHLKEHARMQGPSAFGDLAREFGRGFVRAHVPDPLVPIAKKIRHWLGSSPSSYPWYTPRLALSPTEAWRQTATKTWFPYRTWSARDYYETVRSGYHLLCMESNNKVAAMHGMEMAFPFLDRDLVAFMMAVPGEAITWKGVPKALLRAGLRGTVPEAILGRRTKADFTDRTNRGVQRELSQLQRLLAPESFAVRCGYINGGALNAKLLDGTRVHDDDCLAAWGITDVAALELWLQAFFNPSQQRKELKSYAVAN